MRILVVDDIPAAVQLMERHLTAAGYDVGHAGRITEAQAALAQAHFDLVITDLRLGAESGLELVRHVREHIADTEIMMVTGYPSVDGVVEALQSGASEYLVKPYTEEELLNAVARALDRRQRASALDSAAGHAEFEGLIARAPVMQKLFSAIQRAAASDATVLITGESGTGKELVARAVHYASARRGAAFVPVSCGAIPDTLLESELFGHVRGAFTGADRNRVGFFEAAARGTIFLDEISETSAATQMKLLRVLEERELYMVGSSSPRRIDVRVVAATNKPLEELVAKGAFREDLYYRINVLALSVPPLRDRDDDVLLLAGHFARKYSEELGIPPITFTDAALRVFREHYWPGNVRELRNLVQRLAIMSEGRAIDVPDLPANMKSGVRISENARSLAEVEASHIRAVLAGARGNKTEAARILGIDRKTLYEKLRRYGPGPTRTRT